MAIDTNKRKKNKQAARAAEQRTSDVTIRDLKESQEFELPELDDDIETVAIQFEKPKEQVDALAEALDLNVPSASEVGRKAFDYAYDKEVGE
ncbi:hypothetical protein [Marinobacter salarius]